jgi:SAM-dependent methyltransferase
MSKFRNTRLKTRAFRALRGSLDRAVAPYLADLKATIRDEASQQPPPTTIPIADSGGNNAQSHLSPESPPPELLTIAEFRHRYEHGEITAPDSATYRVDVPEGFPFLGDPHSSDYAKAVLQAWRSLSGRDQYNPEEDESFDVDENYYLARPYPFCSSDPLIVSGYMGAVAATIGLVQFNPPARVVEFGAGWGHLSLYLAASGYKVTAVDLNRPSVDLLRRRSSLLAVDLEVVEESFLCYAPGSAVDIVIFFESFHHCERPFELLDKCARWLSPTGQIVFVADAIYDDFYAPWGVRLDGSATFMTAQHGWLELGFRRSFFEAELRNRGFDVNWETRPQLGAYGTFLVATRRG